MTSSRNLNDFNNYLMKTIQQSLKNGQPMTANAIPIISPGSSQNLPPGISVIQGTNKISALNGRAYSNYPFNRQFLNMNFDSGYKFENPLIIEAVEKSRPAFETINSFVHSLNAVSMMFETTFNAMHMSFESFLWVAENLVNLKLFVVKLYSTAVSFKLVRWFLIKLFSLLRMVKCGEKLSLNENLKKCRSSTTKGKIRASKSQSWPLVVFTGLLASTPYFLYQLLKSGTSTRATKLSKFLTVNTPKDREILVEALYNWEPTNSSDIALVKGETYFTTQSRMEDPGNKDGWLYVDDINGRSGYVPLDYVIVTGEEIIESEIVNENLQDIIPQVIKEFKSKVTEMPKAVDDKPNTVPQSENVKKDPTDIKK